jgi:hypothetical protein
LKVFSVHDPKVKKELFEAFSIFCLFNSRRTHMKVRSGNDAHIHQTEGIFFTTLKVSEPSHLDCEISFGKKFKKGG